MQSRTRCDSSSNPQFKRRLITAGQHTKSSDQPVLYSSCCRYEPHPSVIAQMAVDVGVLRLPVFRSQGCLFGSLTQSRDLGRGVTVSLGNPWTVGTTRVGRIRIRTDLYAVLPNTMTIRTKEITLGDLVKYALSAFVQKGSRHTNDLLCPIAMVKFHHEMGPSKPTIRTGFLLESTKPVLIPLPPFAVANLLCDQDNVVGHRRVAPQWFCTPCTLWARSRLEPHSRNDRIRTCDHPHPMRGC